MKPAVEPNTPSGQWASEMYGEPMSGLISPLGVHFSHELVRPLAGDNTLYRDSKCFYISSFCFRLAGGS